MCLINLNKAVVKSLKILNLILIYIIYNFIFSICELKNT